jgi:hypothetical protein
MPRPTNSSSFAHPGDFVVKNTDHDATLYAAFSLPLPLRPLRQNISTTLLSNTLSLRKLRESKFM